MPPIPDLLEEMLTLHLDDDGDLIFPADEHGYNPWVDKIRAALGLHPYLCIEIFPMTAGGTLADYRADVDHWDILVRPDGRDPIREFEGLTREEAEIKANEMAAIYGSEPDWQLEDLLH